MRAAVYNEHLVTMGGGERYSGMLAAVLAQCVPALTHVDLVGHGDVRLDRLQEHLGIDLTGVSLRLVPNRGEAWVSSLSGEYDLFVNASYMSRVVSRAAHSSYAVYFPTPWDHDLTPAQKRIARLLAPMALRHPPTHVVGAGWFPPEGGRRRTWSWTSGDAEISIAPGPDTALALDVGRPGAPEAADLEVLLDDAPVTTVVARPDRFQHVELLVPAADRPRVVRLRSAVFAPPPPDRRELGVAVGGLRVGGRRDPARWVGARAPYVLRDSGNHSFLDSYDQVVAISEYTGEWVRRLWHRTPDLLYPPVHTRAVPAAGKRPVVLSIGRFFAGERGHSKKQLEMVKAFAKAQERGQLAGWELHLVGGCSDEDAGYLDEVRRSGAGHAVHVHPNAPRSLVEELLATSSVFWHATGLDEDPDDRPWAMEHFGITTVEAMAAGCVPVVIARAGQREIVRDGVDGYLFEDVGTMVRRTVELAAEPDRMHGMATAAQARAETFSEQAFAGRWVALVDELLASP